MLARPITDVDRRPDALVRYCKDDDYAFEQKVNGHRCLVTLSGGTLRALNRRGEPRDLPAAVQRVFEGMAGDFIFDAELLGRTLYLFDIPVGGMLMDPTAPYLTRREVLDKLHAMWNPGPAVKLLPWARTTEAKAQLAARLRKEGCEGVMVKRLHAPYQHGRSLDWLKAKYTHDVDCVVTALGQDGKANIVVAMYDGASLVNVGEVTALAGHGARVQVGHVVTVKVLYSTRDNRLYQPTLPRIRTDKGPEECTIDQLDACRVNMEVLA